MIFNRKNRSKKAFSLIEILITVTLMAVLSTILINILVAGIKMYKRNAQTARLQNDISKVMREFEYSTRAASELVSLNNKDLVFYRYYDIEAIAPTKVHYFVNESNEFVVDKIEPVATESGIDWPSRNKVTTLLIKDVQNPDLIFKYYDQGNTEITAVVNNAAIGDITNKILLPNIKLIDLSISLNDNYINQRSVVSGSTRVNLRNLKTNI